MHSPTKSSLSPSRTHLLQLMQEIRYGRIMDLRIQDGEPVFDNPPTVLRLFLIGRTNQPNESRHKEDFALKGRLLELYEIFDRERSFTIQELMIEDGLPVRMSITDTYSSDREK